MFIHVIGTIILVLKRVYLVPVFVVLIREINGYLVLKTIVRKLNQNWTENRDLLKR